MYPAVAITWLQSECPSIPNKIVSHFAVVFHAAEGVFSPVIVSFATPALWAIIGVIDRKVDLVEDGVKEISIVEAVGWNTTTHGHQCIGCLWDNGLAKWWTCLGCFV